MSRLIRRPSILKMLDIVCSNIYTNAQVAVDLTAMPKGDAVDSELHVTEQSNVWLETPTDNKLRQCGHYVDVSHLKTFTEIAALLRRCQPHSKISFSIRHNNVYTYRLGYFKIRPNKWVMIKNDFTIQHSKFFSI